MNRQERISLHKKQERLQIQEGPPSIPDMKEGVPEIRHVEGTGLVEFVRFKSVLHENTLEQSNVLSRVSKIKWYPANLENSWVAYSAAYNNPEYGIDSNGFVHLRGFLKDGSSASADMFSLPNGFRPILRNVFASRSSSGDCRVDVDVDGDVWAVTGGATTWTSIDGLTFSIN